MNVTNRQWIESLQYQVDKLLKHHGVDVAGDLAAVPAAGPTMRIQDGKLQTWSGDGSAEPDDTDNLDLHGVAIGDLHERLNVLAGAIETQARVGMEMQNDDAVFARRLDAHDAALADLDKRLAVEREASFGAWKSLTDAVLAHDAALVEVREQVEELVEENKHLFERVVYNYDAHDAALAEVHHELDRLDIRLGTHTHLFGADFVSAPKWEGDDVSTQPAVNDEALDRRIRGDVASLIVRSISDDLTYGDDPGLDTHAEATADNVIRVVRAALAAVVAADPDEIEQGFTVHDEADAWMSGRLDAHDAALAEVRERLEKHAHRYYRNPNAAVLTGLPFYLTSPNTVPEELDGKWATSIREVVEDALIPTPPDPAPDDDDETLADLRQRDHDRSAAARAIQDANARDAARLPEVLARRERDVERLVIAEADAVPDAGEDRRFEQLGEWLNDGLRGRWKDNEIEYRCEDDGRAIVAKVRELGLTPAPPPLAIDDAMIRGLRVGCERYNHPVPDTEKATRLLECALAAHWNAHRAPADNDRSGT